MHMIMFSIMTKKALKIIQNYSRIFKDVFNSFPIKLSFIFTSIVGSVVEFSPATRETGVRFPDNAKYFLSQ